MSLKYIL